MKLVDHALDHARRGRAVFPCRADKKPWTRHGFKDACTDPVRIERWWQEHPQALVGLATGQPGGVFVIDLDVPDGAESWVNLIGDHPAPCTFTVSTPSGGRHHYFRMPPDSQPVPCRVGMRRNVDLRGDEGYIIAPASPGYVAWLGPDIALAPDWLLAECRIERHRDTQRSTRDLDTSLRGAVRPESITLKNILARTRPTGEGQRHRLILDLARGLKFDLGLAESTPQKRWPFFNKWWQHAEPVVGTKDYELSLAEFEDAFDRARKPLGADVAGAVAQVRKHPPTDYPTFCKTPELRLLFGVCQHLAEIHGGQFFLSSHDPALLGAFHGSRAPKRLHRMLRLLIRFDVLTVETLGSRKDHTATVYRWALSNAHPTMKGITS